jgi:hypothetical protein
VVANTKLDFPLLDSPSANDNNRERSEHETRGQLRSSEYELRYPSRSRGTHSDDDILEAMQEFRGWAQIRAHLKIADSSEETGAPHPWPFGYPRETAPIMTFWFKDVRKSALIAGVTGSLSVLIPSWTATRSIVAIESRTPVFGRWFIPAMLMLYLFTAILPVFCFALYRDEGTLRVTKRLRRLGLMAALILGILLATALPEWTRSIGPFFAAIKMIDWSIGATSILVAMRDPTTTNQVSTMLSALSDLGMIALLVAFFRQSHDDSLPNVAFSRLLSVVTKVAVIVWGLWVAFQVVRFALTPYLYVQLRDYALKIGRRPPQLSALMAETTRSLLSQACLFVGPYIVFESRSRVEGPQAVPPESGPTE